MLRFAAVTALTLAAGCTQITGVKPKAVPCHGYAEQDTVVTRAVGSPDTLRFFPAHICGMPRIYP